MGKSWLRLYSAAERVEVIVSRIDESGGKKKRKLGPYDTRSAEGRVLSGELPLNTRESSIVRLLPLDHFLDIDMVKCLLQCTTHFSHQGTTRHVRNGDERSVAYRCKSSSTKLSTGAIQPDRHP